MDLAVGVRGRGRGKEEKEEGGVGEGEGERLSYGCPRGSKLAVDLHKGCSSPQEDW